MSTLQDALGRVVADLEDLNRRLALVRGLAVSVRAEPRFTREVDLAVVVTDDNDAEVLSRELQARGYQVLAVVEQTAQGRPGDGSTPDAEPATTGRGDRPAVRLLGQEVLTACMAARWISW
ncbi:hypothetical protein WME75_10840 [Sorangium sp. So ce1014]|uniref:hypothetical protein n=1 Tax=Sorangium sp. So ce1014 TaxID=3133326 RepID=UPI003F63FFF5